MANQIQKLESNQEQTPPTTLARAGAIGALAIGAILAPTTVGLASSLWDKPRSAEQTPANAESSPAHVTINDVESSQGFLEQPDTYWKTIGIIATSGAIAASMVNVKQRQSPNQPSPRPAVITAASTRNRSPNTAIRLPDWLTDGDDD